MKSLIIAIALAAALGIASRVANADFGWTLGPASTPVALKIAR